MKYVFEITQAEVEIIGQALDELPHKIMNQLATKMQMEIHAQNKAYNDRQVQMEQALKEFEEQEKTPQLALVEK